MTTRRKAVRRSAKGPAKKSSGAPPLTDVEKAEGFRLWEQFQCQLAKEEAFRELVAEAVIEFAPKNVQLQAKRPRARRR